MDTCSNGKREKTERTDDGFLPLCTLERRRKSTYHKEYQQSHVGTITANGFCLSLNNHRHQGRLKCSCSFYACVCVCVLFPIFFSRDCIGTTDRRWLYQNQNHVDDLRTKKDHPSFVVAYSASDHQCSMPVQGCWRKSKQDKDPRSP